MLSPREVAEHTGLCYRSVLRAIEDGELRAYRLRNRLRVEPAALDEWLSNNVVQGTL